MDDSLHHIPVLPLLLHLLVFFGIAGIAVPTLERLKLPPVLGYLLCGMAIGPYGIYLLLSAPHPILNTVIITDTTVVNVIGELGIIFLMFMIGLELSLSRLRQIRHYVINLGISQIVVTAIVIFSFALWFGVSVQAAILVGFSLALSSTAITMELMAENHTTSRPEGLIGFSILLMQDLAVVPLLVALSSLSSATGTDDLPIAIIVLRAVALGIVGIGLVSIIGIEVFRPLLSYLSPSRNSGWLIAFSMFVVTGSAALTQSFGLSAGLGAFLAGLLISETEFRHQIEASIDPIKNILLGIFFLSVGMSLDLRAVLNHPILVPTAVIGLFLLKSAILYQLCRAFHIPRGTSAEVGIRLAQGGEFAFLLLASAAASGLLDRDNSQFFLLVTALSMSIAPVLTKLAPIVSHHLSKTSSRPKGTSHTDDPDDLPLPEFPRGISPKIIIGGFGRVGMTLGVTLEQQKIPYIAFDNNPSRVKTLARKGYHVTYGDIRRLELWEKLNTGNSVVAVICSHNTEENIKIVAMLKSKWPKLNVIVRARDSLAMQKLYELGATSVTPEALEASLQMARHMFECLGLKDREISEIVKSRRTSTLIEHDDLPDEPRPI